METVASEARKVLTKSMFAVFKTYIHHHQESQYFKHFLFTSHCQWRTHIRKKPKRHRKSASQQKQPTTATTTNKHTTKKQNVCCHFGQVVIFIARSKVCSISSVSYSALSVFAKFCPGIQEYMWMFVCVCCLLFSGDFIYFHYRPFVVFTKW